MTTEDWSITFHPEVSDDLQSISGGDAIMILEKIDEKLRVAPTDFGQRLKGDLHPLLRLRVQTYRVVYEVNPNERRVRVLLIGKRKNVYKIAKKIAADRRSQI